MMRISKEARKNYPIRLLPTLPEALEKLPNTVFLYGNSYWIETSKTCTEEWGVAFVIQENGDHTAYRYLKNVSFGYGG